ncbi:hypothetical protein EGW08_020806 [Elysia chlorotica]|uniref:Uncharacterized protein n=1 Tax=Elysia chlorotica TaxID=188477 RepID=A0A433SQA8_ELYCH|nr:hypothetical protein EGW08_020806 [Elysia chlorotica]
MPEKNNPEEGFLANDVKAMGDNDSRTETHQSHLGFSESNQPQEDHALSQGYPRDTGLQQSPPEERPSSHSRASTPTTMVAITMRAMRAGNHVRSREAMVDDQPTEHAQRRSFSDGTGALRRWSKVHQAIVSADQFDDNALPVESHSRSTAQLQDLNVAEQAELEKLGFRKPTKSKKKKKKKSVETKGDNQPSAQSSTKKNVINLKEDPVLMKVSKKNQNVGKFTSPPEPKPNAVCFEVQGSDLTHCEVKAQVQKLLRNSPEIKITEMQFHHRSLINNIKEMNNRWIITTNSVEGRNRLAGATVSFPDFQTQLRRYDDIVNTEYQQFTRMSNFAKMMHTRLGHGGKRYDDIVNTEYQQFTRMSNFAKMMHTRLGHGGK